MYPDLPDLRRLERKTLKVLVETSEFGLFKEMQDEARRARVDSDYGGVDVHLHFVADVRMRSDAAKTSMMRRIDIGALIESGAPKCGFSRASYSLLIAKGEQPAKSPVLRKVHFDVEPQECRNTGEPKPTVHMQVCGKLSRAHVTAGYTSQRLAGLYPHFEKPRIPCSPTSLALLIDWVMLEFQSDTRLLRASRSARWRALVSEAEQIVLKPYFTHCLQKLSVAAQQSSTSFSRRYLYEVA